MRGNIIYCSRSLQRYTGFNILAAELECEASSVVFEKNGSGKPFISAPNPRLQFSLSHSGSIAFLATAWDVEIGVDVEIHRSIPDSLKIAEHNFAPSEYRALRGLPSASILEAFFECWVSKEAVTRAAGEGLKIPLNSFTFASSLHDDGLIGIQGLFADGPWSVRRFRPDANTSGALAWRSTDLPVQCYDVKPGNHSSSPEVHQARSLFDPAVGNGESVVSPHFA